MDTTDQMATASKQRHQRTQLTTPVVSSDIDDRDRAENRYTGFSRPSTGLGTDRYPAVVGPTSDPGFSVPEVPGSGNRYIGDSRYPTVLGHPDGRVSAISGIGQPSTAYPTSLMNNS